MVRVPGFAKSILRFLLNHKHPHEMLGDHEEIFCSIRQRSGGFKARLWLWGQVFAAFPPYIRNSVSWGFFMFVNSLKIVLRTIKRHKGFSFINIAGLAMGMMCFLLVFIFGRYETTYDSFHPHSNRLYRVLLEQEEDQNFVPHLPLPLGPTIGDSIPDVEAVNRMLTAFGPVIKLGKIKYQTEGFFMDAAFFSMFHFPLEHGDIKGALLDPYSVVLTPELAKRCFPDEKPLGKTLRLVVRGNEDDYTVTGVLENNPEHTFLQFDLLLPFNSIGRLKGMSTWPEEWDRKLSWTFVRLKEHSSVDEVEVKILSLLQDRMPAVSVEKINGKSSR
ncbi:ABC transporter permease, partial [Acidobacteriota bacterium]